MKNASKAARTAARDASRPAGPTRRVRRRVPNPLFGSPFVRTKAPPFPSSRKWRNPLIVSPSYKSPELDDEQRVVGEAENPSAWESALMRTLEIAGGSLGGFGWNLLAGTTLRQMNIESAGVNDALGYLAATAPALAFATLFRGDEPWKGAMAGASLYDVWETLARKLGVSTTAVERQT